MNKPVYLVMSTLDISKIMYEFWSDYMKPKYKGSAKLCYMDTGSLIIHIKTEDIEKQFDTSNYDEDQCNSIDKRPLPTDKNKKVIGHFKDELEGRL